MFGGFLATGFAEGGGIAFKSKLSRLYPPDALTGYSSRPPAPLNPPVLLPPPIGMSSKLVVGLVSIISTSSVLGSTFLVKAGFLASYLGACSFFEAAASLRFDLSNSEGLTVAAASSIFYFF
jgi:hypothetical protein